MAAPANRPDAKVVQAAARLAFQTNPAKQRLALALVKQDGYQMTLEEAAKASWVPPKDLLAQLKTDGCFQLIHKGGAGGALCTVVLHASATLSKARGMTTTGFLSEELPPPTGYVAGVHPIRPGQPSCPHFTKYGECMFKQHCVYHHPGKPSGQKNKQPAGAATMQPNTTRIVGSSAGQQDRSAPPPQPSKPAWGGAGLPGASLTAQQQQQQQQLPPPPPQQQPAYDGVQASLAQATSSMPNTPGGVSAPGAGEYGAGVPQMEQQQQVVLLHLLPPPPPASQLSAAGGDLNGAAEEPSTTTTATRPTVPCHMMMLRGFCPVGAKCPYDHPQQVLAGAGMIQIPPTPIITTDVTAAASNAQQQQAQGPSPLAAAAEPSTPAVTIPLATASAAQSSNTNGSSSSSAGGAASAGHHADSAAGVARSWRDLLAEPQAHQQQQQLGGSKPAGIDLQSAQGGHAVEGGASAASTPTIAPGAVQAGCKLLGWTDGSLPQLSGACNCPFFMGTGQCKFRERCIYHHPPNADHPEAVLRGELPRRYNGLNTPSYARLVNHLYRLWDYDSCVESQLKIWLAKHLLQRNNLGAEMFSSSASKPATHPKARGFHWQVLGPYTCSMGEAGELLHHMWRAQPDAASREMMPYTKQLRELLTGDPYFEVVVDKKCKSHYWVRLNIEKVKSMLNF